MRRSSRTVMRWLIFCFPVGLLLMWNDRCRWSRGLKSAISLAFAAAIVLLILPQTAPPERKAGGVQIVSLVPAVDVQGPMPTADSEMLDVYVPVYVPEVSVLVEPTPTPVPIYVFCNDGGKNYHVKGCRYVKETTPRVTLTQALNAGYKQCDQCNAPNEYGEYKENLG